MQLRIALHTRAWGRRQIHCAKPQSKATPQPLLQSQGFSIKLHAWVEGPVMGFHWLQIHQPHYSHLCATALEWALAVLGSTIAEEGSVHTPTMFLVLPRLSADVWDKAGFGPLYLRSDSLSSDQSPCKWTLCRWPTWRWEDRERILSPTCEHHQHRYLGPDPQMYLGT